jgi:hypothetical protein
MKSFISSTFQIDLISVLTKEKKTVIHLGVEIYETKGEEGGCELRVIFINKLILTFFRATLFFNSL